MIKRFKILPLPTVSGMRLFRREPKVRECQEGSPARSWGCAVCAVTVRAPGRVACCSALWRLLRVTGGREAGLTLPPRVGTKHAQMFVCKVAWPSL